MKFIILVLIFIRLSTIVSSQSITQLAITGVNEKGSVPIIEKNGLSYFSVTHLAEVLNVDYRINNAAGTIEVRFPLYTVRFTAMNPFLIFESEDKTSQTIYQLPTSTQIFEQRLYAPLKYSLEYLSKASEKSIELNDRHNIVVGNNLIEGQLLNQKEDIGSSLFKDYDISGAVVEESDEAIVVRLSTSKKVSTYITSFDGYELKIIFRDVSANEEEINQSGREGILKDIFAKKTGNDTEIKFSLTEKFSRSEVVKVSGSDDIIIRIERDEDKAWYVKESRHFRVLYKNSHSYLSGHILTSAERSLSLLMPLFDYTPSEKIIIALFDINDYGFGAATAVPQNFIRLEIEPMEPGYENILYNERFQWLLSHELVHIAVNDNSSEAEKFFRSVFSKAAPEQNQPLTIPFSLITNVGRYTPRWHQESMAVFMETWMSGGFGRTLGNFDEMFFRSLIIEGKEVPDHIEIDTRLAQNNFLLENNHYLYGTRFATYLAITYGHEKLVKWFSQEAGGMFSNFKQRFRNVFGISFDTAWKNFAEYEDKFQRHNIVRLKRSPNTLVRQISTQPDGWVTQPYLDRYDGTIIYGYHKPNSLAALKQLNLRTLRSENLITLPTPSLVNVASVAFDENAGLVFFTTNNNELYRDIWVYEKHTGKSKLLFKDARVGHLTVSPVTRELWGIQHSGGKASLVFSPFPYNTIEQVVGFDIGDEVHQLSVNQSGSKLAAVLQRSNGSRAILLIDCERIKAGDSFKYDIITESGSPENPSWNHDGTEIYWNAYTNGVSNIYKRDIISGRTEALSHTLKGLFKPVFINKDSVFVFEFTTEGFVPAIIQNKPARRLPALDYLGQRIVDEDPAVLNFILDNNETAAVKTFTETTTYNGFSNLNLHTFIPVITGFLSQKVLGFYTRIADPLLYHDLTVEAGISPFKENKQDVRFHIKAKYDYKKNFEVGVNYNEPDFYDLFNKRKKGMLGERYHIAHNHYWIYDNPLKIKQRTEIALYRNIEFFIDNLVKVGEPDFLVAQTNLNSKNIRRSIGSVDSEAGDEFNFTTLFFAADPKNPQYSAQFYGEWDKYFLWLWNHNVFHFKVAAGYHLPNDNLFQAKFFFGGFGNRQLEHVSVKQYRNLFRFPGIPIYSIVADDFGTLLIENSFPPIHFNGLSQGSHYVDNINLSVFSKGLLINYKNNEKYINAGAQINFVFKHWFNLESTFSAGIANAWFKNDKSYEWFLSYKLLKN